MTLSETEAQASMMPTEFSIANGMLAPVPEHLREALAPATWLIHEWCDYQLSYADATHLRVASERLDPTFISSDGMRHFRLRFENQLGLTTFQALRAGVPSGDPLHVEVIAKKFPNPDHAVAFLRDMLADLFTRGEALPFAPSSQTQRSVRTARRSPSDLFAYHFFRHHRHDLVRAIQAVLGEPHRRLSDRDELVRVHEVRRIDLGAMLHILQGARSGNRLADPGISALHRLQPERVRQRIPEETLNTPENRFMLAAARLMYAAIERIRLARWYAGPTSPVPSHHRADIDAVHHHLRQLVTDRRLAALDPEADLPAQSRVLQRRPGYREMTLLWSAFHRFEEPVYQRMERAIDLRDVATLYEHWLLFELIEAIARETGIVPTLRGFDGTDLTDATFIATYSGHGTLRYQPSYSGTTVWSGITLKPDFVWETMAGPRIVMDAKFRIQYPWPAQGETLVLDAGRATTDDIAKMHTYRDAIRNVAAALVLYPGVNGYVRTLDGAKQTVNDLDTLIGPVVRGELEGIGAIPMSPVKVSEEI